MDTLVTVIVTIVTVVLIIWFWKGKKAGTQTRFCVKETQTGIDTSILTRETQTDTEENKLRTLGTQTKASKTFTDNITVFGTHDLDAEESLQEKCEICELGVSAVGFCTWCQQHMCLKCCKHHEKILYSKNHVILGKNQMKALKTKTSLFGRLVITDLSQQVPYQTYELLNIEGTGEIAIAIPFTRPAQVAISSGKGFIFPRKKITCSSAQHSGDVHNNEDTCIFYVLNQRDVFKYCTEHYDAVFCFSLSSDTHCVAKFNKGLAVLQFQPTSFALPDWKIQFLDYKGNVKNQICYDLDGQPLLKHPYSLVSDKNKKLLYICDEGDDSIVILGTNGKVVKKVKLDEETYPRQIVFDEDDNIYLACAFQVLQINQLRNNFTVLFTTKSRNSEIVRICYDVHSNKFAAAEDSSQVTVFSFLSEYQDQSGIREIPHW